MNNLPQKLTELIKNKGISDYKIAKKLRVSPSTIANYKNGKTQPSFVVLKEISKILEVSENYFLEPTKTQDKTEILKFNINNQTEKAMKDEKEKTKEELLDEINNLLKKMKDIEKRLEDKEETIRNLNKLINSLQNQQHNAVKANR